jgi:O-glycosyl hydrolase
LGWNPTFCLAGDIAIAGSTGRLRAMALDGDYVDVHTNIVVHYTGWKGSADLGGSNVEGLQFSQYQNQRKWSGRIKLKDGVSYRYEQVLREADGAVRLSVKVAADGNVPIEAVNLIVSAPVSAFSGGRCEMKEPNGSVRTVDLPRDPPEKDHHLITGKTDRVSLSAADASAKLEFSLDRPVNVMVQDERKWKNSEYAVLVQVAGKDFCAGQSAAVELTLKLTGTADHAPAELTVDPRKVRYKLDGFGGCYCFGVESPVSRYTLDNLRVAWARTEMKLHHWEPTNDNGSPDQTDWEVLKGRDKPDSRLHRDFLWMQELQRRGIPYVISVWQLPDWLYAEPNSDARKDSTSARHLSGEKWPELLECIGSYLVHAKKQYGVEPDLFSFNEPDCGVRVKLSGEEHRDAIKRIGPHLGKLGLKTRMLLADVASARVPLDYCHPTINDPEAMRYVGAIGFHSWGGAKPQQYAGWGDLAEKLKLPLLVAEVGVDADWRTVGAWRDSYLYALREFTMYQELLLYARAQGTMQWELTEDYSTVAKERDASGTGWKLTPKKRFWCLKHFFDLTPRKSDALATASTHPKVLFTAFAGPSAGRDGGGSVLTLHVANTAAGRPATISGLPTGVTSLRAVRSSEAESYQTLAPVPVRNGVVKVELAPQSLLTLTTMSSAAPDTQGTGGGNS